ncbi:MAG: ribonuclease R, partial [Candidatus Cloacimonas sp.]|nr:ribonuclease R [Candidatus Cloacimonas sp.]
MNYNELRKAILDYLKRNPHTGLSYNELVNTFQLHNTEKSLLSKILSGLQEEEVITKNRKKYQLLQTPEEQEPSPTSNPKLLQGIFDATSLSKGLSFAFIRTPQRDYYVAEEDTYNAFHNDVVAFEPKYRKG